MRDERTLRAYLLDALSPEDRTAIEQDYFGQLSVIDRLCDAEDDLIEAYLSHRLTPDERERVERSYLASPAHRARVAIARALRAAAEADVRHVRAPARWRKTIRPLAVAAAVVLMAAASIWWLRPSAPVNAPPSTTGAANAAPVRPVTTFAVALEPVSVRGASDRVTFSIPAGTDLIVLNLAGDPAAPPMTRPRAVLRTVEGAEIWRGAAASAGASARVEVPAARLPPGDYLVELTGADSGGRPRDRIQYFLRVRQ